MNMFIFGLLLAEARVVFVNTLLGFPFADTESIEGSTRNSGSTFSLFSSSASEFSLHFPA